MGTEIKRISTSYNVSSNNEELKMNGTFVFSDKVDNLNVHVTDIADNFIGNVSFSEVLEGNSNFNFNVGYEHLFNVVSMVKDMVDKIKSEVTE